MAKDIKQCPCGSGLLFSACCEPFVCGERIAPTAEALMRSRYTAYTLGNESYLLSSWHKSTSPATLSLDEDLPAQWIGLKIIKVQAGQENDDEGLVEFVARYKVNGKAQRLHETSRFVKEKGKWFYLDGDLK